MTAKGAPEAATVCWGVSSGRERSDGTSLLMSIVTGQLILGADRRNPLFTVYGWEEDDGEELLHVYYGLELLQVVPADRNAPSFKMLSGRLYNAGVNRRIFCKRPSESI